MKGLAAITMILLGAGFIAALILLPPFFGVNLFAAGGGQSASDVSCDDDGLVRLLTAYQDSLSDDQAFLVTDVLVLA